MVGLPIAWKSSHLAVGLSVDQVISPRSPRHALDIIVVHGAILSSSFCSFFVHFVPHLLMVRLDKECY